MTTPQNDPGMSPSGERQDVSFHPGIVADERHKASIPEAERCAWCGGTGNELYAMYRRCPECDGTGRASNGSSRNGDVA